MKIALTMIVRGDSEAEMFKRCLASFMPYMDGLYVAVTGLESHKEIHKIVATYKGKSISTTPDTHPNIYKEIETGHVFAHFAEARNVSWSIIDQDYDWYAWADVDDVLQNGEELRTRAEEALKARYDSVFFPYLYAVDLNSDGTIKEVIIEQLRERLLRPGVFKWVSRLHEVCVPIGNYTPKQLQGKATWVHLTNIGRVGSALTRNAVILEMQVEEEKYSDPRTLFSLAKVYIDKGSEEDLARAIDLLIKYMTLSGWDAERSNVLEYLGMVYEKLGNLEKASETYHRATFEYPKHILPYLKLANVYFELGRDEFAKFWLDMALKMPPPKANTTISNPKEIKLLSATLKLKEAQRDGDTKQMVYWAKVRDSILGHSDGVLKAMQEHDYINDAARGIFNYSKWLKDNGYEDKIPVVLESLPESLSGLPFVTWIKNSIREPKTWGDNTIVYYASFGLSHFEKWDHESLKTGIGGSETAVIELTERWAKDYDVTVFADVEKESVSPAGVKWLPYNQINWKDEFNIMILWRSPHLIEKVNAKKLYMDLHDIAFQIDWDEKRMEKIDKVFFKSLYHRKNLPKLPDDKAVIISNGI